MNYTFPTNVNGASYGRRGSNARNAMGERSELGYTLPAPVATGDLNSDVEKSFLVQEKGIICKEVRRDDGMECARSTYGTVVNDSSLREQRQTTFVPHLWEWIFFGVLVVMGFVHWYGWGVGGEFGALLWDRLVHAL